MSRNTIESLRLGELATETGVRVIGASDGFDSDNPQSSLLLPVLGSMNEAFITQLRSKVKRGMDDAFRRGDNIQPPGVGYRLVDVKDADGNLVITHKNTIEKAVEIDPEAAAWIVRGAKMIAREGKSPIEIARLFNEQKVGDRQTWSDNMIRKLYSRERLVGREVFRVTRQEKNRHTGKVRYVKLPQGQWLVRESPHLRILTDELAAAVRAKLNLAAQSFGKTAKDRTKKVHRTDLYPKVLIRPVRGGCGTPMILGRSLGKYQSFCCFNASSGIKDCTNKGYKSARIIDEAVLGAVMATLFTDDGRQLAAKREQLRELQRACRRPKVKSIKEKDVVAALTQLRDLLQGDVGIAAQVLKALVGDVMLETRQVEGKAKPQMVARFTINAVPALAAFERGSTGETDGPSWQAACSEHPAGLTGKTKPIEVVAPLSRKCHRVHVDLPATPPADSQPPQA